MNTPFRSSAARSVAVVTAGLAVVLSSGATLTASAADQTVSSGAWSATEQSERHAKFVDEHGLVLPNPQLYLIYWGRAWAVAPTPTAAQVTDAVGTLMASDYLTGLTQYRGSGRGALRGTTLVATSDPHDGFTDRQVAGFVDDQISAGTVPGPDPDNQTVYGVVMPTGVTTGAATWGMHNYFTRSGQRIHYAWFTNVGDLDSITEVVSHEFVESATDPEGTGFGGVKGTCDEPSWCEIADVCESTLSVIDGITVQAYWSNRDNNCIAPGSGSPAPIEREPVAPTQAGTATIHPTTGHAQGEAP